MGSFAMNHPIFSDIHSNSYDAQVFCNAFINSDGLRFVFGINQYSTSIANCLDIDGFIDDFATNREYLGKPVFRLEDVPAKALIVSTATMRPFSVEKRLKMFNMKFLDYYSFYKYSGLKLQNISFWEGAESDFRDNREKYEYIYSMLADDKSRDTFRRLVNFKLSYDLNYMRVFEDLLYRQYFEDFLNLASKGEVFADIGGFDGCTTKEFMKRCPDYKGILFFEPSLKNMTIARQNLINCKRIKFYQIALSNKNGIMCLTADGSASRLCDGEVGSASQIPVARLDDIAEEEITFIKMDIEGAESEAIDGAQKIIMRQHPKLAIAVYHKPADFWSIPYQILKLREDYSLFMRHYSEGKDETVMFFVPRK